MIGMTWAKDWEMHFWQSKNERIAIFSSSHPIEMHDGAANKVWRS